MSGNNTKSLGEAIREFIDSMKWHDQINQASIINDWDKIAGRDIARFTTELRYKNGVLTIKLNSSALRQELHMRRTELISHINQFYGGKEIVKEIKFI
ncbi:MAG: hypothetical protein PWR03_1672 [Tenuifilum sp.]|jgi:predicted nucleic acid-binding Zn ribbon protein|uniref:DUF721 domain-containing protein n=1 Tax=Tenuifilum sp. TaxID=2760880 RepID=UPI0024AADACA|nr:DUF721 domain-containing protein [Tenuifilum sp.]MDI3527489.1 hypothetical protein [Tenuifilum sp.]